MSKKQDNNTIPMTGTLLEPATEEAGQEGVMLDLLAANSSGYWVLSETVIQQNALLLFFMVVALVGNGSVMAYLVKSKNYRNHVSIFVLSLAISDFLIAIFSMSTEILWDAFGEWVFGSSLCKLATYVQCLLFASTAFILMSISYDRYEAICRPMKFTRRTLSRSRKTIILSWFLAIIVAIPQLFIFRQARYMYVQYYW